MFYRVAAVVILVLGAGVAGSCAREEGALAKRPAASAPGGVVTLEERVRRVLPANWSVKTEGAKVVVNRDAKVSGAHHYPSMSAGDSNRSKAVSAEIWVTAVPLVPVETFKKWAAENEAVARAQAREDERLRRKPTSPPLPHRLPTHHDGTQSYEIFAWPMGQMFTFDSQQEKQECEKVLASVRGLFTAY